MRTRRAGPAPVPRSAFAGFRFPPDVIVLAVRWYLRFGLSYRDVEELLAERGIDVDHTTSYRWSNGSRRCWPTPPGPAATWSGIAGSWTRPTSRSPAAGATSTVRSTSSAKSSTCSSPHSATPRQPAASSSGPSGPPRSRPWRSSPTKAATYPTALGELLPAARHRTDRYANNHLEADTAGSRRGCVRCAGSSRIAAPRSCSPAMASSRTCGVAITNWPSRNR